jgi:hypothetical protein
MLFAVSNSIRIPGSVKMVAILLYASYDHGRMHVYNAHLLWSLPRSLGAGRVDKRRHRGRRQDRHHEVWTRDNGEDREPWAWVVLANAASR